MSMKTGFFDKNGREIVEGDSLRVDIQSRFQTKEFVVEWNSEESRFALIPKNFFLPTGGIALDSVLDTSMEVMK